ncbi:hypothetical protein M2272_004891 [Mycobacterium frederiksbergense]|uniref:Uncharacterized protein n=1 Tax=Mycolicibacterium frederiksbergense TaxID=117567 RepID=A0ABT6L5L7_9MYCO|nr:Rv0340 family IniB-related protein [Mycolicibacterium frederiksbergense]MDH6198232.1 hypothetical protein [Mycolicibacterium frederiksbergense]
MANSLLDFVMSLVRDPEAAARYAADPGQAISDAHLADVTSADVNNLIPLVSESLPMTGGLHGAGGAPDVDGGNVWASGAATAAFDAFGDHVPADVPSDTWHASAGQVIDSSTSPDHLMSQGSAITDSFGQEPLDDLSLQVNEPIIDDAPIADTHPETDWAHPIIDDLHHTDDAGGFDIFG